MYDIALKQFDRRSFLKVAGVGTCGIVALTPDTRREAMALAEQQESVSHADLTWGKPPCRYCGTGGGVQVGVRDGRVMAVRGDEASPVNRRLLCVKRYHLPAMLYGKDRFLHPMRRDAAGHDPYVKKKSGVHFYKAKKYGEKAAFWLRPYHPPAEVPDEEYSYWLCTGRVLEHWHTGSMTRRVKELHQAVPEAYVEINRADAIELGINNGDLIRIASRRGKLELPARVDGRGQPPRKTVFVPFFDEGRLINRLTLDAMDNISKQPDYKKCAVRIECV